MDKKTKSFTRILSIFCCFFSLQFSLNIGFTLDFNVGQGQTWENEILAPFVDISTCIANEEYSNNGATKLIKLYEDTGIKTYTIGFINVQNDVLKLNDTLNWSWGGYAGLNEVENDHYQYEGIKQSIREIRSVGGDVIVSIGGPNEMHLFQSTNDLDILINTYMEIIDGYNLTRICLDIEGEALGYETNQLNAKALKVIQDQTDIDISLTLPATTKGLDHLSLETLNVYLDEKVNLSTINIINICEDTISDQNEKHYGDASIKSIEAFKRQLSNLYKSHDMKLTDEEIYHKIGITVSIDPNEYLYATCSTECSESVIEYSKENKLGMVSFISIAKCDLSEEDELDEIHEYATIFNNYSTSSYHQLLNSPPSISGVINKTIYLGDSFDVKANIIAMDEEDGLLELICIGTVDTNQLGDYNITYSAIDSKGESITANRKISVVARPTTTDKYPHWNRKDDMAGMYTIGTVVTHNGQYYEKIAMTSAWCEPGSNRLVWRLLIQ